MGTTLTGTTPQDTYDSLIKVTDNGPISGTAKYLSDGLGNDSALALSTSFVGIGTDAPDAKLHSFASSGSIQTLLKLENASASASSGTKISFTEGGTERAAMISQIGSGTTPYLAFENNGAERMRITSAGNVGIGTTAPAATLDIVGSSSSELGALRLFNSRQSGAEQQSVSILMRNANTVGNFPSVKLIAQESTADSNLGQFIVQASNDNSATLVEVFRTAPAGAGGAPFLRMASGTGGIQFNGDTAAANALDDYEEGTWTMGVAFGGASAGVTTSANTGTYTKIGRQVTVNGYIQLTSKGSSTGAAEITGLPFTIGNSNGNFSSPSLAFKGITFTNQFQGEGSIGSTTIKLQETTVLGTTSVLTNADFADTSYVILSLTYFV